MPRHLTTTVAIAVLLAGCGGTPSPSRHHSGRLSGTGRHETSVRTVAIRGFAYHPARLTIPAGTRIVFVNRDGTAHTATSTTSAFDSGTIPPGGSRGVVLSRPGVYRFYCQFHAFMRGEIVVR